MKRKQKLDLSSSGKKWTNNQVIYNLWHEKLPSIKKLHDKTTWCKAVRPSTVVVLILAPSSSNVRTSSKSPLKQALRKMSSSYKAFLAFKHQLLYTASHCYYKIRLLNAPSVAEYKKISQCNETRYHDLSFGLDHLASVYSNTVDAKFY